MSKMHPDCHGLFLATAHTNSLLPTIWGYHRLLFMPNALKHCARRFRQFKIGRPPSTKILRLWMTNSANCNEVDQDRRVTPSLKVFRSHTALTCSKQLRTILAQIQYSSTIKKRKVTTLLQPKILGSHDNVVQVSSQNEFLLIRWTLDIKFQISRR